MKFDWRDLVEWKTGESKPRCPLPAVLPLLATGEAHKQHNQMNEDTQRGLVNLETKRDKSAQGFLLQPPPEVSSFRGWIAFETQSAPTGADPRSILSAISQRLSWSSCTLSIAEA